MTSARAALAAMLVGWGLAACSTVAPPRDGDAVVTLIPAIAHAEAIDGPMGWPYPDGSRLVRVSPEREPRELSAGLISAGAPDVDFDGRRVLFAGRAAADPFQAIYEIEVGERAARRVYAGERHCGDPAYLAHAAIVFACETPTGEDSTVRALFVLEAGRSEPERITWSPADALEPTALADGRILFAMPLGADGGAVLYTVNADGSLPEPFGDHHATGTVGRRPRQQAGGDIVVVGANRHGVARIPFTRPTHMERVELGAGIEGESILAVEPDGDALLVVTAHGSSGSVVRTMPGGETDPVALTVDDLVPVEAIPLRPTTAPRGRPRIVSESGDTGFLVGYDAGRTDGIVGPPQGSPVPHAVRLQIQRAGRTQFLTTATGSGSIDGIAGVSLHGDRSFFFEVPADVPLRIATVDEDDRMIASSSWFWVRPGETRACFGCHAGHAAAPINRPIEAIQEPPVSLFDAASVIAARHASGVPTEAGQ